MIKRAIVKLNEEGGSTEEAISEFIRREYEDLPLAHVRILDIHLRKFCLNGELVRSKNGRYVLVDCDETDDNDDCLGDAVTEEHSEAENSKGKMAQAPSEAEQPQIQTSKTVRKYDQHSSRHGCLLRKRKNVIQG
ncbi:Winged helix-like DNA-binding domain superfamily [Sesbania bispinosa]|nr:Winged helix-like DNA-binding domain superfamily [Sesbania bispinosa]